MTNIVGITAFGIIYIIIMILLFVLFFIGKEWVMLTGLFGFLAMGLMLSITITRYNYVNMVGNKNMVEVSRTEEIPEITKVGNIYRSNWKTVQIVYGLSHGEEEYYSVMRSKSGLFIIEGGVLHTRNMANAGEIE
ncbi:hypothetical protein [Lacrimispora aerotolerans]|uniref:hypothetical protein n=1 Tax=Lacrimispora aerotolerans TaxID=36832 RepID=UPI00047E459F|nr:hypothetical protein [Lacrimispora aerotolerans]